jgi:hypothetical protein
MSKLTWTETSPDYWTIKDPKGRPYLTAWIDRNPEPGWVFLYLRKPKWLTLVRRFGMDLLIKTPEQAAAYLLNKAEIYAEKRYEDRRFYRILFPALIVAGGLLAASFYSLPAKTNVETLNLACNTECLSKGHEAGGGITGEGRCGCYLETESKPE